MKKPGTYQPFVKRTSLTLEEIGMLNNATTEQDRNEVIDHIITRRETAAYLRGRSHGYDDGWSHAEIAFQVVAK